MKRISFLENTSFSFCPNTVSRALFTQLLLRAAGRLHAGGRRRKQSPGLLPQTAPFCSCTTSIHSREKNISPGAVGSANSRKCFLVMEQFYLCRVLNNLKQAVKFFSAESHVGEVVLSKPERTLFIGTGLGGGGRCQSHQQNTGVHFCAEIIKHVTEMTATEGR